MSQDASTELLEIENKISKIDDKLNELSKLIWEKNKASLKNCQKGMFESYESWEARREKEDREIDDLEKVQTQLERELSTLEARKKQLNEELFAGLDESDDF